MGEGSDLQFEKAEFAGAAAPSMACAGCQKPIPDSYFQLADAVLCGPCKTALEDSFKGGSGFWRLVKATLYGSGIGLAGALIYCGTIWATNYNLALITIFIGIGVGRAVRAGSGNRGGLTYQLLAVFLTYVSMAIAFAPLMYKEIMEARDKEKAEAAKTSVQVGEAEKQIAAIRASAAPGASPAPAASASTTAPLAKTSTALSHAGAGSETPGNGEKADLPEWVEHAFIAVMCVVMALGLPFMQIAQMNVIGVLIFGFGLYEAWKANAKLVLEFQGPFAVAKVATAAPAETPPDAGAGPAAS